MIKTIVFDLDNTLMDWKEEYIFALKNVINKLNLNYDENKIKEIDFTLVTYEKYYKYYNKEDFVDYLNKECNINLPYEFADLLIEEQGKCYEVFEGEKLDTIKYLSSKYELICISNWFTKTQIKRLENAGIAKYFKKIIGGDIHELKPSLNAFKEIENPKYSIMIGDNIKYDILPAIEYGMKAILLTNKEVEPDSRYKVIRKLEDLKEML